MTEAHLHILRSAIAGTLPDVISEHDSDFLYTALEELVGAGLLTAKPHHNLSVHRFRDIKITLAGRNYLAQLEQAKPDHAPDPSADVADDKKHWSNAPLGKIGIGVFTALVAAGALWAITHYFSLS